MSGRRAHETSKKVMLVLRNVTKYLLSHYEFFTIIFLAVIVYVSRINASINTGYSTKFSVQPSCAITSKQNILKIGKH